MANFIQYNGNFYPLAGNKIAIDGILYDIKDSDKIIIGGKPYYMGNVQDFQFPEIYDASYYLLGKYGYNNNATGRFSNPGYTEIISYQGHYVGLLDGKVEGDSSGGFHPDIENLPSETLMAYPVCVTPDGDIYYRVSGYETAKFGGVGKKIAQIYYNSDAQYQYVYFRTVDNELYYQGFTLDKKEDYPGRDYLNCYFDVLEKIADNCTYLSPRLSNNMHFFISDAKLYYINGEYSLFENVFLYDDSGLWNWINYKTETTVNGTSVYGYGICDGRLMRMDGNYPTVLDESIGWTMVSEYNMNIASVYAGTDDIASEEKLYGICFGNLYQISRNRVSLVSDSGDWVKVWGSYRAKTSGRSLLYAYGGKNNGHFYRIEDTTVTDLGSIY